MGFLVIGLVGCDESSIEKVDDGGNNNQEEVVNNNEEENEQTENNDNNESNEESATENLAVGDSVNFNDVTVTLNEVRIEPGGEWDDPDHDQFIVVNLTAENNSDEEITISSMLNIELYDEESYSYSTTILMDGIKSQFDGSIPAGKSLRGEIPFDVPESSEYELHYSEPFMSGKAIWTITSADLD